MSLERAVDASLEADAVLIGSLPPEARDLDLVVPDPALRSLERRLAADGFTRRRHSWARFRGCDAEVVELQPVASLRLPRRAEAALFGKAAALPGTRRLRRPAPHHTLLLLARRHARAREPLRASHRRRIDEELTRDPSAWDRAASEANDWGAALALALLRAAHERDAGAGVAARRRAVEEELRASGRPAILAWASAWRWALRRGARRGTVIALSGLDGSGKSSLAEGLCRSLATLGYGSAIVWSRFGDRPRLDALARRLKRALGRAKEGRAAAGGDAEAAGRSLRRRSPWASGAWVALLALETALLRRARVREELRRGRVVLCDRYTLDSYVRIRYRYGAGRRFGAARWILRRLPPAPRRAYWLAVPPEVAMARKREHYAPEQLAAQHDLYTEEHAALGVRRLDGTRSTEELCADVAAEIWRLL